MRKDIANLNYINAPMSYWRYYYNLRKLSLYDFENKQHLSQTFDKSLEIE
ncbi:MAG: hypothetical protein JXB34_00345 [Bacteroidales bacterium]|nr:hypothetical protein [Bacteroidales bacterium]